MCKHAIGTPVTTFDRIKGELRAAIVCDRCRRELQLISIEPYRPQPKALSRPAEGIAASR